MNKLTENFIGKGFNVKAMEAFMPLFDGTSEGQIIFLSGTDSSQTSAIVNSICEKYKSVYPNGKALKESCESLIRKFIDSIKIKKEYDFSAYISSLNLLCIEGIDFIEGKGFSQIGEIINKNTYECSAWTTEKGSPRLFIE